MTSTVDWMSHLSQRVADRPISHLAIPGSYNSASYDVSGDSTVSEDAPLIMRKTCVTPLLKDALANWMKHQSYSILQQLEHGIRYFDFKIAHIYDGLFHVVNGLECGEVKDYLNPIHRFLEEHPKEVVFVKFGRFFQMDDKETIKKFESYLTHRFGKMLLKKKEEEGENLETITLSELWKRKVQFIVLFDQHGSENVEFSPKFFVKNDNFTVNSGVSEEMNEVIEARPKHKKGEHHSLEVWDACVSVRLETALMHPMGNFEREFGRRATRTLTDWISKNGGKSSLNIVATSFADEPGFCEAIIKLNH